MLQTRRKPHIKQKVKIEGEVSCCSDILTFLLMDCQQRNMQDHATLLGMVLKIGMKNET
jgi:hypothetical protein